MSKNLSLLIPPVPMLGSCRRLCCCLLLRNDNSTLLICVNWSMICWSTKAHPEAAMRLVTVDRMLISILSVSVEALELCAVAAEAWAPRIWELKPDDLLSPLHKMCELRNPTLSLSSFDISSSALGPVQTLIVLACRDVSFVTQTRSCIP